MKLSSWCLFVLSAVLYAVPLIFHAYAWWVAFLFPVPLFYVAVKEDLTFIHGYMWGLIALSIHLGGVFFSIDKFSSAQAGITRLLPVTIILAYICLYPAIWFWINQKIKKRFALKTPFAIIALWTITLWCLIFALDRLFLFPFDRIEGYFCLHPILALATHPQLLMLMPYIGKNLLSLLLYMVPASLALFLAQPTLRNAGIILLALLPWCISLLLPTAPAHKPAWLDKIAIFPASFPPMSTSITQAEVARQHFRAIEQDHPEVEIIILPESSFHCDHLSTEPALCDLWSEDYLGKPMHIIVGAFRWDGTEFRNSLHWIYNGEMKKVSDKRHAMILTERVPSLFDYTVVHELFARTFPEIQPSALERPLFEISDSIAFTPYICSELFFNEHPDDAYPQAPILAVTNDNWCKELYITQLMYLDARLKAIQWQRDILYASFEYAALLDKYGNEIPILMIKETLQ